MCTLNNEEKNRVAVSLAVFVMEGAPFTGWQVAQHCDLMDASAYVRELFNKGAMPGWASTQVHPVRGPVLYFKVPYLSRAGFAVRSVRKVLKAFTGE